MCILLHPDIKEGLSFTMQPEMICLETPLGIGNRDQIYARIIRALRLTNQGDIPDSKYFEILPVIENGNPIMYIVKEEINFEEYNYYTINYDNFQHILENMYNSF